MLFLKRARYKYLEKAKAIDKEEANWEIEKKNIKRRNKIREEYKELTESAPNKLSMSKKALIFLFVNCSLIEIFTAWTTVKSLSLAFIMGIMPDFTPLVALIGAIVGEVIGLAAYYVKSTKENTRDGITFESAAARNFGYYDDNSVG